MSNPSNNEDQTFIELTAEVVAAYVSNNPVPASELPALIGHIHAALKGVGGGTVQQAPEALKPAVPVKKSVTPDYIVCLEDGKKFKMLRRHLMSHYGLTPEEYRAKWNLPGDYPVVAPNYAARRSALAKTFGLGRKPKEPVKPVPAKSGRKRVAT